MKKIAMSKLSLIIITSFLFAVTIFSQSTPEEMQTIIDANGYDWQAGWTSYSNLSSEELAGLLGISENLKLIIPPDPFPPFPPQQSYPSNFDWRNYNGNNYVTEIKSQREGENYCGSCYAFATTAALESRLMIDMNKPNANIDLAEQMMVGQCNSCVFAGDCGGGNTYNASYFMNTCGVAEEWCDPYQATSEGCLNACSDWISHRYFLRSYYGPVPSTVDDIKNALMEYGPLVAGMNVTEDFMQWYTGGVYQSTNCCKDVCSDCGYGFNPPICLYTYDCNFSMGQKTCVGFHAITIVGWQDTPGAYGGGYFICKNSWGKDWGIQGYFYIAFDQMDNCINFGKDAIAYTGSSTEQSIYSIEGQIKGYYGPNCCLAANVTAKNTSNIEVQHTTCDRKPGASSFYRMLLPNGTYTLTATKLPTGYSCQPQTVTLSGADQTGKDFIAYGNYSISGNVSFNGSALPGVAIKITGTLLPSLGITLTTDLSGNYSIPYLGPGTYTLTPSLSGYTFIPSSQSVSIVNGNQTQNFTAAKQTYSISGNITKCGSPDPEVTVKATGNNLTKSATTNSYGNYTITDLSNGTYTVKASKGFVDFLGFTPSYRTVTIDGSNITGQDFEERAVCHICTEKYFQDIKLCSPNIEDDSCYHDSLLNYSVCLKQEAANPSSLLYGHILLADSFNRAKEQPITETETFTVREEKDYFINVINGDMETRDTKVSSATIDVSSLGQVFGPGDFNKNVNLVSKPVHLLPGDYTLSTEVRSQPGSYITIIIATFDMSSLGELP